MKDQSKSTEKTTNIVDDTSLESVVNKENAGNTESVDRMKALVELLSQASKAYYQESREIMSNLEYDRLYDELAELEKTTGIVLAGSPTVTVGYEILSQLPKETHQQRMLSLDKTKDRDALSDWLGSQKGLLSWKLDGLTIVLTYNEGELAKAVTRGNGDIGEVVTANAKAFENLPHKIPYKKELTLRGEAVIKYSDFEKINNEIEDAEAKYKNPRNLCSGAVRQLNSKITKERHVNFFAFSLVGEYQDLPMNSREEQLKSLTDMGFDVVEYKMVNHGTEISNAVEYFSKKIEGNDFPSDGLVLSYDDIEYGKSLGTTAKFPRDSIAFKWQDEMKETVLKEIEWSPSRTGLINPVAIFEPVELEGTTVSRASVHNVSMLKELKLGIGDTIKVYKANMIIPQIAENQTKSGNIEIPRECPACNASTQIKAEGEVETLHCTNPECPAKHIKAFGHFVSRDAINIEGFSEATAEKLISKGILKELSDIFKLENHRDTIIAMEGFKEKSYENLISSINKARKTTAPRLLYSLGISGIGSANAKLISAKADGDFRKMMELSREELLSIQGVGEIMAENYASYFENSDNKRKVEDLLKEIEFEEMAAGSSTLTGKTFVITGSLENFGNRGELQSLIEVNGGKVASSVSAKTSFLINNDNESNSSKNKSAKKLGIPIITENEFLRMIDK